MPIIYEPKGKAREYAPLALNLYRGCAHGCKYCYAPRVLKADRIDFHSPALVRPRPILRDLEREAAKLAGDEREILLSFTSDPYQPIETDIGITRAALKILMSNNLTVTILTKGGSWGLTRDVELLTRNPANAWSVTLTFDDPLPSRAWEPYAALPNNRIESLRLAKRAGLKTWVSFEPVIDPEAVYRLLDRTHEFVDLYKVGKLNYHPLADQIDWRRFRGEIEERLTKLGKPYYLKKGLIEAAQGRE